MSPATAAPSPATGEPQLLVVTNDMDVGGAERHLVQVLPRLRSYGFRPMVYTLTHRGVLTEAMEAGGVPVVTAPCQGLLGRLPKALRRPLALLLTMPRLWALLRFRPPAIVHFFLPTAYLIGAPCAIAAGARPRLMSRRTCNHYQGRRPFLSRLEPLLHPMMDRVLGNSRVVMADLAQEGVPEERLGLIYNGIETAHLDAALGKREELRRELGIAEGTLVMVVVANLYPYKGHADLLEALAGVRERLPREWLLLCVGRDQGTRAGLEARAEALGIGAQVRFLGQRNDVERILPTADIGLLVSHEEGFSNGLLEEIACGLPMVVTDVSGSAEVVEDGVNGYVVPPRNPAALGEAIVRLISNPRRAEMGAAGRERVRRDFTIERCVAEYAALYRGLLADGDGTRPEGG